MNVTAVFETQNMILNLVWVVLLAVKVYAVVTAIGFPSGAFQYAEKLTKPAWLAILGIGVAFHLLMVGQVLNILPILFTIAAFVYLADVLPALREVPRRR